MDDFIAEFRGNVPVGTCQGLIALFNEAHKRKLTHSGRTGKVEDKARKDSTDLSSVKIPDKLRSKYGEHIDAYLDRLMEAYQIYQDRYPILKHPKTWAHGVYEFNIQRYYPGGQAYHAWHYESAYPEVMDRVLAWMTYLTTVEKGGETEFQYLDVMAKPEQGKTLIWPAGFTHTHRGRPAPDEVKFIITGWFCFAPRPR